MPSHVMSEIRRKLPLRPHKEAAPSTLTEPSAPSQPGSTIYELPIDDIIPNRSQPRSCFNQNAILRLSDSIRRYGILQPLTVRKVLVPLKNRHNFLPTATESTPRDATYLPPSQEPTQFSSNQAPQDNEPHVVLYELIAGERRLRAAKLAELTTVPCIIVNTDDSTSAELAIIENLLREDLNMFEQAEAFRRLIDEFMLTQDEVARRVSLSQSAVANKLRILRLTRHEREIILQAGLTERHARALLKISDEPTRITALNRIVEQKLNVSSTETYIDQLLDHIRSISIVSSPSGGEVGAQTPLATPERAFSDASMANAASREFSSDFSRRKAAIRDIRLFYNSIRNAASILEQAGVRVELNQVESGAQITITAKIFSPKEGKPI